MIVMVVIGLLAAIAIPAYTSNISHAREAVLKEDLHVLRQAIDSYTVDKQKAPQTLDDLVQSGYIKVMPKDPFTHRTDTWMPVQEDTLIEPRPDRIRHQRRPLRLPGDRHRRHLLLHLVSPLSASRLVRRK